jgi:hypothetical protein
MRHGLGTDIDIAAPPEDVWAHLVDFAAYREWNPFMPEAAGTAEVGHRLTLRMRPPGGRAVPLRPRVTEARPGDVLEWLGHLGVPGLFDGRHRFELVATASGTKVRQSEAFSGLLVRPLRGWLDENVLAGFEAMNAALRDRVLAGPRTPG